MRGGLLLVIRTGSSSLSRASVLPGSGEVSVTTGGSASVRWMTTAVEITCIGCVVMLLDHRE
ncbi:hypothetical protein, partial [Agrobacterium rosae]